MRLRSNCVGLLLMLTISWGAAASNLTCPTGWFSIGGNKCYKLFENTEQRMWNRAAEVCESYGSRLALIKDQYESNALGEAVGPGHDSYWIGLKSMNNELRWHKCDAITEYQGLWSNSQPAAATMGDCVYSSPNEEQYVYDRPYTWSFSHCSVFKNFICEREAAPTGSFHCFNGGNVADIYRCDGQADCADSSDELDCSNQCHKHMMGTGNIDLITYQNSQTCMWAIETPVGTNVYIEFTRFNTESEADYVHVYIGSIVEINAQRVASLSGTGGSIRQFRSYNNMMLIKFSADSMENTGPLGQVQSGFSASYNYVTPSKPMNHTVELTANDLAQTYTADVKTLGGVDSFIGSTDDPILIKAFKPWEIITVEIGSLELHDSDEVLFFDGEFPYADVLAKLCTTCDNYNTVFSTGDTMSVYLRTERQGSKNVAFSFTYKQGCHVTTTSNYGVLFSPGYAGNIPYPRFVTCTWQINSDKPLAISFNDDSQLQGDTFGRVNNGDYVQIYTNGSDATGTAVHTDAGFTNNELAGVTFQSDNGKMFIQLKSSPTRTTRGFMAHWSNDCEDPAYDDNTLVGGQVQAASYHYKASNALTCSLGHRFQQEQITPPGTSQVIITCGYKGIWDNYLQIPRCTPVYCGDIPSVVNGYIKSSTDPTYGNTATYECFSGSALVPASGYTGSNITCRSDGTWSPSPTCQAASCSSLDISLNAANLVGTVRHGDREVIGSIVDYMCHEGFELVGEPILFCQTNGTWSGMTPSCRRLTCLVPDMQNGAFQITGLIPYQQSVNVDCNMGYTHIDLTVISVMCQANRSLTELPQCVNEMECQQAHPCSDGCVDTEGSFYCTCPSGYYLHSDKHTCLDINECVPGIHTCDQNCINNGGSYTCSCTDTGYVLYTADGTSGYGIPPSEDGSLPTDTYHINQTCVLISCPTPNIVNNGKLLTNRVHHRYGDRIEYMCDLGYNPRSTVQTCQSNGQWSGQPPTCQAATCPADVVATASDKATYDSGPYPYDSSLDLNCTVATTIFTKQRHCVYDRVNDAYRLFGAEYQCGVVDCGQPEAVPGSNYAPVPSTLYQAFFTFRCEQNQAATGESGDGTTVVTCGADGYWNLGSLQCFEQGCDDPGYPAGGKIIATSFADNSEVTFECTRPGYELSHTTPLKCFGNTWNGIVPTCTDEQRPTFSNCDNVPPIQIEKYGLLAGQLMSLNIQVSDNTGIKSLMISPSNANSTYVVENDGTVTYTARDFANNIATCQVQYSVIDETPPTIACPSLHEVVLLDDTDSATYTITNDMFNPADNSGNIRNVEIINSPQTTFTFEDLYNTFTYTVQVKDNNENTATCKAQIFVTVSRCTPLSFPTPLHADKTCTEGISNQLGGRAYSCYLKCQDLYTFQDSKDTTVTCDTASNSGAWSSDWIPACIRDTIPPVISCPTSEVVFLRENSDAVRVDFTTLLPNISDVNEITSVLPSIPEYTFTTASLYQAQEVTVTVVDKGNNVASCRYHYMAKPSPCSPLSYPNVVNADVDCSRRTGINLGYDCTITANAGYILRDYGQSTVVSCNDGSGWDEIIPAAVTDTTAPTVSCPESRTITLATLDDIVSLTMGNEFTEGVDYTVADIGGVDSSQTTFSPAALTFNANSLYKSHQIDMTVYDLRGNRRTCDFDITVLPLSCSPLSLPTPVNGDKTCSQISGGYQCIVTCNSDYGFDFTAATSVTLTCNNGVAWANVITACTQTTNWVSTIYVGKYLYSYIPVDQTQVIPNTCPNHYMSAQADVYDQMAGHMLTTCGVLITLNDNLEIQFVTDQTFVEIVDDGLGNSRQVNITYKFKMLDPVRDDIVTCADTLLRVINTETNTFSLSQNIAGNDQTCPELDWIPERAFDAGNSDECFTPRYKSLVNQNQCLFCPLGTNSNAATCQQCPIGRYKSEVSSNKCEACPDGMTTRYAGSTSVTDCIAFCPAGSYSASGYQPCFKCSLGTYSGDSGATSCDNCNGQTTASTGSTSQSQCVAAGSINAEQCPLGTEAGVDGTCRLCEVGWYRSVNLVTCTQCPLLTTSTYVSGATAFSQCYGLCGSGLYSVTGLPPCIDCPKGTYWKDSTTCALCDQEPGKVGYTTRGTGATSINQCISSDSLRVACPPGTKRDGNSCVKCPIGDYQDQEDRTVCNMCGTGRSTYFEGATSSVMCFSECADGFTSATGLSPCSPCGVGSYSLNSTTCQPCETGKTTATNTAGSAAECIDPCPLGQFSYIGYNFGSVCRNCPANYYQDSVRQTDCKRCTSSTLHSIASGLTSLSDCRDAETDLCYSGRCQNNGDCIIRDNTYLCNCPIGFYGRHCETLVAYCNSNPCHNNGLCSETRDGHTCDCRGWATGDNCDDLITACTADSCEHGGDCLNRPGSTDCLCRPGFTGATCVNVQNICLPNPCQHGGFCSDVSLDLNLRRKCSCQDGYTGKDCETNIDDCAATDTCLYGGTCTDLVDDYSCQCQSGYGGKYCHERNDRCAGVNCGGSGVCVDDYKQDLPRCICKPGYQYGTMDQYTIAVKQAPSEFGTNVGSMVNIDECREQCTDQCDRFTYEPATSTCYIWNKADVLTMAYYPAFNTYTKYTVYPDDDFYTLWYNMDTPTNTNNDDIEERSSLNSNFGLNICGGTEPVDVECRRVDGQPNQLGITCNLNGLVCNFQFTDCADYEVRYKCAAHRVFLDSRCSQKDYCTVGMCENGGTCHDMFGGYQCSCLTGYTGRNCQTNINECANNPCQNGGTCLDDVFRFECSCVPGWTGSICSTRMNYCLESQITCNGHGNCQNPFDLTTYVCECFPGYTGADCENEIDMCDSSPCIHDGTCVKLFNSYRCDCVPGFHGLNCQDTEEKCPTIGSLCSLGGTCHNIFNNYYCECPSNTYGDNCENQPNPCGNYNKCLNGGVCSVLSDTSMQCACPGKYSGNGCEMLVDHCGLTNRCQNDGQCLVADSFIGYTCQCALGYKNANCDALIDNCVPGSCPGGTCYNDVGKSYCRCPLGKTGTNCMRDFDRDYDLFFNHPSKLAFAWIPVWTLVENVNAAAVSMWVRYTDNGGTGIYLTMFLGDRLEDSAKFMEIMDDGVTVYVGNGNTVKLVYTHNFVLNDGNWHNIVFNYDMVSGTVYLVADSISHTQIQEDNLKFPDNTYKFWTVLGCQFDQAGHRCVDGGNNFHGLLSQVTWYSRMLHTINDIPRLIPIKDRQMIFSQETGFSDVILVWNEYQLEIGVSRNIPSEAGILACSSQLRTLLPGIPNSLPPCTAFVARQRPYLASTDGCPNDVIVYSPNRITSVSWDEPVFQYSAELIRPEYQPDGAFHWGVYPITYIAVGANDNTAVCHFKVYVQSSQCETPLSPVGGSQTVVDNNPDNYKGSDIYCYNDAQFRTDRLAPELFTCDLTGSWNIKKPFQKFRYPACGLITNSARVRINLRVAYVIATQACDAMERFTKSRTLTALKEMHTELGGELCGDNECSDADIIVDCSTSLRRRKRQIDNVPVLLEVMIPSAVERYNWGGELLTMKEYITYKVLGAGIFNLSPNVPDGDIEPSTFAITTTFVCPLGEVYVGGDCVRCGPGNYYVMMNISDVEQAVCHDCPLGTYQDEQGVTSCKHCASSQTTEMTGSYEVTACKKKCAPGQYFDNDVGDCRVCEIGYYQKLEGQFYCDFCLSGETTKNNGSTSRDDCKQTCPSGEQLVDEGICEVCPIGQYRDELQSRLCRSCQTGLITPTNRSTSVLACTITACEAGTRLLTDSNSCEDCPKGTYQDTKWQTECISCGDPTRWTSDKNSVASTACKYYCPSGFEVREVGTCDICMVGFYKDNTADMFGNCAQCGGNLRTPGNGSTSSLDCSIYKCPAGSKPNANNDNCVACPLGSYQPIQHSVDCESCPGGTSTEDEGSLLESACKVYCSSGQKMVAGICIDCPRGTYKNNMDGLFDTCTPCPDGYTTAGNGTETLTKCSVRACPAGTRRNVLDTDCIGCDYGEYQDQPYLTSCIPCPSTPVATSTRVLNATSESQCEVYCSSGMVKISDTCVDCNRGYYKDNIADGVFADCTLCPLENITETTRSTSVADCIVGNCSAGYKLNSVNVCEICPKGTFQADIWQPQCNPCGTDKTTENEGAISGDLCILVCPAGDEDIGGACQECQRGFYKEIEAAAACTPCNTSYTTEGKGAVQMGDCLLPACTAGEYLDRAATPVCRNCPYDNYQASIWQEACDLCPDGQVTLDIGASSEDQCVLNCTSGQEYNPATDQCDICVVGFYRDQSDRTQTACQACAIDKITPSQGSTSVADCSLANCTEPGQYRDETSNTCEDCPIGTHNSQKWVTACTLCGVGYTTLTLGNTNASACRPICVSGYYVNTNNVCEKCPVGTYRTAGVSGEDCLTCPIGLLTPASGAESIDRCTVSPCVVGQWYDETLQQCGDCPKGTYQDQAGARGPCTDCPFAVKYTPTVGAIDVAQCNSPCDIGEELDIVSETCMKCNRGYYQPSANQFTCTQCPVGQSYTQRTGATSGQECQSPCHTSAVNECSTNATCQPDADQAVGYSCQCFTNYVDSAGSNALPGRQCTHLCDTGYCKSDGQCVMGPDPYCMCSKFYEGNTCQYRIHAEDLSTNNWKDIVIPVCIGVGALLLLLIAAAIFCFTKRFGKKPKKPSHYSDFHGERVEKGSIHSFDNFGQRPGSRIMMAPGYEVQYDNQAFHSSDSAVYEA